MCFRLLCFWPPWLSTAYPNIFFGTTASSFLIGLTSSPKLTNLVQFQVFLCLLTSQDQYIERLSCVWPQKSLNWHNSVQRFGPAVLIWRPLMIFELSRWSMLVYHPCCTFSLLFSKVRTLQLRPLRPMTWWTSVTSYPKSHVRSRDKRRSF